MKKKNQKSKGPVVYSTDPDFKLDDATEIEPETLPNKHQNLRLQLDKKHRGGKTVTLVLGFEGKNNDLQDLAKKLKNHCGTGGSAKNQEIIIQGDQIDKIKVFLEKDGYNVKK